MKSVYIFFGIIFFAICNIYAAKPEWVEACGNPAQYPSNRYLTGFGVSSVNDSDLKSKMESAKRMAYLSIAESVRLRIVSQQSSLIGFLSNQSGPVDEIYRSQIVVSSLMELRGVTVLFYNDKKEKCVYALAVMDKKRAADYYDKKIKSLRFQLQRGDTAEWEKNSSLLLEAVKVMAQIRECRLFAEIIAVSYMNADDSCKLEVFEKRAERLLDEPSFSIDDLVSKLMGKIYERLMILDGKVLITPFFKRGSIELSSVGSKISGAIENCVSGVTRLEPVENSDDVFVSENAAIFEAQKCGADYLIRGTYSTDSSKKALFELEVVNVISGTVLGCSHGILSADAMGETECSKDFIPKSSLDIEIETGRGKDNLVFEEGEVFQIYIKVNKPCYLLLMHSLPDGLKAVPELTYQNYYIGLSDVNRPYPLPDTFSVVPPFGEESISVYVSERPFPQLQIVNRLIDGQLYRIVTGEIKSGNERGLLVKSCSTQVMKKSIKFTTISKR